MTPTFMVNFIIPAALTVLFAAPAFADSGAISVLKLETIYRGLRAGEASAGVLVTRENRLQHHIAQDHVLYLVRGKGVAQLENASGPRRGRSSPVTSLAYRADESTASGKRPTRISSSLLPAGRSRRDDL